MATEFVPYSHDRLDGTPLREMAAEWLNLHGYDGLTLDGECGCGLEDLMPCGQPDSRCACSYKGAAEDGGPAWYASRREADRSLFRWGKGE